MATQKENAIGTSPSDALDRAFTLVHELTPQVVDHCDWSEIPTDMGNALLEYLATAHPLGDFLQAVVVGELHWAAARADLDNFDALGYFGRWILQSWPTDAYGSRKKLETWKGLAHAKAVREKLDWPAHLRANARRISGPEVVPPQPIADAADLPYQKRTDELAKGDVVVVDDERYTVDRVEQTDEAWVVERTNVANVRDIEVEKVTAGHWWHVLE